MWSLNADLALVSFINIERLVILFSDSDLALTCSTKFHNRPVI